MGTVGCSLNINSDGIAALTGHASANPTNTESIRIIVKLQQKSVSGSWLSIVSYAEYGESSASISKKYSLTSHGNYRVVITAIANGSEKTTLMSYDSY